MATLAEMDIIGRSAADVTVSTCWIRPIRAERMTDVLGLHRLAIHR